MKVVGLSVLRIGRLYSNFCYRLSRPKGHSAAGRIMSMKNLSGTIGNRTRDLQTCRVNLYVMYYELFTHPHLSAEVMKGYGSTSTQPLGLRGLLQREPCYELFKTACYIDE